MVPILSIFLSSLEGDAKKPPVPIVFEQTLVTYRTDSIVRYSLIWVGIGR